jgi:hypothetical protein
LATAGERPGSRHEVSGHESRRGTCMDERVLQKWFVAKAQAREVCDFIENRAELTQRVAYLQSTRRQTEMTERLGLEHAERICWILAQDKYLFGDRSVAPAGVNQMRPDLVIVSSGANYVLIELKTNRDAERQAVQELLAYSASVKMQQPYVNEFIYVVVAGHWTTLLAHSVRALILDGKNVLPLQWTETGTESFALHVRMDLFRFDVVQSYDPWKAMLPYTLAIPEKTRMYRGFGLALGQYFTSLSHKIVGDCERLLQSGFVLGWATEDWPVRICSLTIVTVNQNWLYDDDLYEDPSEFAPPLEQNFDLLLGRVSVTAGAQAEREWAVPNEEDFWAACAAREAIDEHYPPSSLSADILLRHRDRAHERRVRASRLIEGDFDCGSDRNLGSFINHVLKKSPGGFRVCTFQPFGELADFRAPHLNIPDSGSLVAFLEAFREHKRIR